MPSTSERIAISEHIDVAWANSRTAIARCPNCGKTATAPVLLEIDYRPPGENYEFDLTVCPECSARFFNNSHNMDYATEELIEIGWHAYQIQTGAGLWPITEPLTRIAKPTGARILEIGGAYGFGLDFAQRALGWTGKGYDPSPLTAFGASELGLDLKRDYFEEKNLETGPYDIVLATEVIEHLPDPPAFLRLMARALTADGILLLTAPDGEKITPQLNAGSLLPMLSPGAHLVLQTAASLRLALQRAGLPNVEIRHEGLSLIAYASASPFQLLDDWRRSRKLYRDYLLDRSDVKLKSDLCLGFAGRALFEAVNDADFGAAAKAWEILVPAVRGGFGFDLNSLTELPAGAASASLAVLASHMPLGLGMILYSRTMWRLMQGAGRAEVLPSFRLALAALDALQDALAKRSLIDALAADLSGAVAAEIALCLAEAGDMACVAAVLRLRNGNAQRYAATFWGAFVRLVNRASFATAHALQEAAEIFAPQDELDETLRLDALFTTGILALQDAGEPERARAIFAKLRDVLLLQAAAADGEPGHLFWPALRGEVVSLHQAGREEVATALLQRYLQAWAGAPDDLRLQVPAAIPASNPF